MTRSEGSSAGTPMEAYIGDPATRLVHRHRLGCPHVNGVFFLHLTTAVAHGYHLCACCRQQR